MNPPGDLNPPRSEVEGETRAGETPGVTPKPPPGAGIPPNRTAELLADLPEPTGLISVEQLRAAQGRAGAGSLAARHHMPFVDSAAEGVQREAVEAIPSYVLERVGALPYRLDGNTLRIAIADPTDVQKVDELRLATRYSLEIGAAAREDIELELRKVARASEVWERAALVEDELVEDEAGRRRPRGRGALRR